MKKLTIVRTFYGFNEIPVIMLDYNNGGEMPSFEIIQGKTDIAVIDRIGHAVEHGFEIEYIDKSKEKQK